MKDKKLSVDFDYSGTKAELETVLASLKDDNLDIDQLVSKYKKGLELASSLEDFLNKTKNEIKDITDNIVR